jgi:hypothetical protein
MTLGQSSVTVLRLQRAFFKFFQFMKAKFLVW